MTISLCPSIITTALFLCPFAVLAADQQYSISQKGDTIVLSAGVLSRTLQVSGGKLRATGLVVDGAKLLSGQADEVSLSIARTEPNRNPVEVSTGGGRDRRVVNIPWVRPESTYRVTSLFRKKDLGAFTGKQLQEGELSVKLPPLGQDILELSAR